jgi:hypothetical protein
MTNPQDVVSMTGPEVIAAPTNITVYQEGKTILPDVKVGVGFSGINMMQVGQTAAKVAGDVYTTYQNGQFADKERLLQQEKTDLADKLEIFAYRNQWGEAEKEKAAHQKRVDNILGWSSDSQDGGEMAKRLNTYARSITADYSSKVAIGSMREKDNVENQHLDILGANFERVVKESKTPQERDSILDSQAKFAALELDKLGIKQDKSGNPVVDAESLLGHSEVERARILKLENMRHSAIENKALFQAKDKEGVEKNAIGLSRQQLTATATALSTALDVAKEANRVDAEGKASGRLHNPSFVEDRAKAVSQNKSAENMLFAILSRDLKAHGLDVLAYTKDGQVDYRAATLDLSSRLPVGDDSREYLGQINGLANKVQEFKQIVHAPVFKALAEAEAAQYDIQQTTISNLVVSNETRMAAINSSAQPEAVKADLRIRAMGQLEADIKKTFDFLLPSAPQPTSNLLGRATSNVEDQENYYLELSHVPGIELNALYNSHGVIDDRFVKAPAYVQASFKVAFDAFNKQQEKYFGASGIAGATRAAAKTKESNDNAIEVIRTDAAHSGDTSVSGKRASEAASSAILDYGLEPGLSPDQIIPTLRARLLKDPTAKKLPTAILFMAYPELMSQMAIQGNEGVTKVKEEFWAGLSETTDATWTNPAMANRAKSAKVEMPDEVITSLVTLLKSGSDPRGTAALDIPSVGRAMLHFNPSQRADLIAKLQAEQEFSSDVVYKQWVGHLEALNTAYTGGPIEGFIKGFPQNKIPTAQAIDEIRLMRASALRVGDAEVDPRSTGTFSEETLAKYNALQTFKANVADVIPSLVLQGMGTTPITVDNISPDMRKAIATTFASELANQSILEGVPSSTLLKDSRAKERLYGRVNETLNARFTAQLGDDGMYRPMPAPPASARSRATEPARSTTSRASDSVNLDSQKTLVIANGISTTPELVKSNSTAVVSQWVSMASDKTPDMTTKHFAADPVMAAVLSQVDPSRIPQFGQDSDKNADATAVIKAAIGVGNTNADIMAAHAAIASFPFNPSTTKEDTLAGIATMAASARKALNGEGNGQFHVVYETLPANVGTGDAKFMVLKDRQGRTVSTMQLNANTVDSGVGDRISYKGYADKQIQELMYSEHRSDQSQRDGLTGSHDVAWKFFNDNPDRDTITLKRRVVEKGERGRQLGFIDRWHNWAYDTLNSEQSFTYTRQTDEDGKTFMNIKDDSGTMLRNGNSWKWADLDSPTTREANKRTAANDLAVRRDAVRRAGMTAEDKMAEDRGIDLSEIQPRDMQGGLERWMMGETVDPTLPPDPAITEQLRRGKLTPEQRTTEDTGLPPSKEVEAFKARRATMTQAERDAEDRGG